MSYNHVRRLQAYRLLWQHFPGHHQAPTELIPQTCENPWVPEYWRIGECFPYLQPRFQKKSGDAGRQGSPNQRKSQPDPIGPRSHLSQLWTHKYLTLVVREHEGVLVSRRKVRVLYLRDDTDADSFADYLLKIIIIQPRSVASCNK